MITERVTVKRPVKDDWGQATSEETFTESGWFFASGSSEELTDKRNTVISGMSGYATEGTSVKATDVVVRANGERYSVTQTPSAWSSPFTGWAPGTTIPLEKVTG